MPGTPILTNIESNIKSLIESILSKNGYHYDWSSVNEEDLAKAIFPCAMVYLDPEETNLDNEQAGGAHAGTYLNRVNFRIHVVGKLDLETKNPNFEANAVLTKALDDLKKLFGINYSINDYADSFMYVRSERIRKQNGDIFIPCELDTFWVCQYMQLRNSPDLRTCT
jgi:hypothetical protein